MEMYKPWLEYALGRDEAVQKKETLEQAKLEEQNAQKEVEVAKEPLKDLEVSVAGFHTKDRFEVAWTLF